MNDQPNINISKSFFLPPPFFLNTKKLYYIFFMLISKSLGIYLNLQN